MVYIWFYTGLTVDTNVTGKGLLKNNLLIDSKIHYDRAQVTNTDIHNLFRVIDKLSSRADGQHLPSHNSLYFYWGICEASLWQNKETAR